MIDLERLVRAHDAARRDLLAWRTAEGHWVGRLSGSALSTATAISALALVDRHASPRSNHAPLIARAVDWLLRHQNDDGGWGDTDRSRSNIATTMLVRAAMHLAGVAGEHAGPLGRAEVYLDAQGGIPGLRRRYGRDKTFAVPILTNCALAGLVPWDEVSPLPFELACFPHPVLRFLRLPVVSYAVPALVAIGQARYFHRPPRNPVTRLIRRAGRRAESRRAPADAARQRRVSRSDPADELRGDESGEHRPGGPSGGSPRRRVPRRLGGRGRLLADRHEPGHVEHDAGHRRAGRWRA